MKFLDKVVEVLGDEPCSLRDYQKILEAGLTEIQVGLIPPPAIRCWWEILSGPG